MAIIPCLLTPTPPGRSHRPPSNNADTRPETQANMSRTASSKMGPGAFLLSLFSLLVLFLVRHHGGAPPPWNDASSSGRRHLASASASKPKTAQHQGRRHQGRRPRILYIVTTLSEYNTGTRATVRDSDRLQETTIPVVTEGIRSMLETGYDVDLALVCHYTLLPEREALVRKALPSTVGLQVWNDAAPLAYDTGRNIWPDNTGSSSKTNCRITTFSSILKTTCSSKAIM